MYIANSGNIDPAFRYEGLARFTFDNCSKYGDPWHYAAQEVYANFIPKIELKGRRILSAILTKLVFDNKDTKICKGLIEIENSIWTAVSQQDAIKIIDNTITTLQSNA